MGVTEEEGQVVKHAIGLFDSFVSLTFLIQLFLLFAKVTFSSLSSKGFSVSCCLNAEDYSVAQLEVRKEPN